MKSPIKFENDLREYSKAEKVTLVVILALVVIVVISWAADGFAFNVTRNTEHDSNPRLIFGYGLSATHNVVHPGDEHNKT